MDYTGQTFGDVLCLGRTDEVSKGKILWQWRCNKCGNIFKKISTNIVYRGSHGCTDCAEKYRISKCIEKSSTHNMTGTKEWTSWRKIKERCYNKNDHEYCDYGGNGILMYEEWRKDFTKFLDYIGRMPDDGVKYTCGRIDNNVGYFPGNVKWENSYQQARNKTLQARSRTGVTGVQLDNKRSTKNDYDKFYFVATWRDLQHKRHSKYYSVDTYGYELAQFLAEETRDVEIRRLNLQGAGYSPSHGKQKKLKENSIEQTN